MTNGELLDGEPLSATDRLLEGSWDSRERRASRRELLVDGLAAAGFLVAAAGLLAAGGWPSSLHVVTVLVLVAVYAVVVRVEFPVGAGFVVPTQLVLVPMLVLLAPAVVPLAVGAGLVIGNLVDCTLGRVPPRRVLSAIPDAWHAIGAAGVLLLAGSPTIRFDEWPVLAAALGASCAVDLVSSMIRLWIAGTGPGVRLQLRVIGLVWGVDAALAPVGFLVAIVMEHHSEAAILFVLPLVLLLSMLARDRSQRIEQAHHRLQLVVQERHRLQSAVRRLGDAFAAKLELDGLLEILLRGSVEALDAAGGRLELDHAPAPLRLGVGTDSWLELLDQDLFGDATQSGAAQVGDGTAWYLRVPMRVAATPRAVTGSLSFVRGDRAFEADEIALISELVAKVESSAAEIIAHEAIRTQAMTDALTGLGNRRALGDDLFAALANGTPSVFLLCDLDGFKGYNDTFGHLAGDALLTRLGGRLQAAVRGHGRAYRLGGDEFCAHLALDAADPDGLIPAVAAALTETGPEVTVQASIGVVVLPREADSVERALQLADERMYANKRSRSSAARTQTSDILLRMMAVKEPTLDRHSRTVAELAERVARHLGLAGEALDEVSRAAELHDIGKIAIPETILNSPDRLSPSEWEVVHQHTILGERILHGAPALRPVAPLVRASHERWDGAGYPDRLRGDEIPLGARIVSVCDAYEAMTADRCYRPAVSHRTACSELTRASGTQFDPAVVAAFLGVIDAGDEDHDTVDAVGRATAHVSKLLAGALGSA